MSNLNRSEAPSIHPMADITLASPENVTLSNGIPLYILNNSQLDLIHVFIQVRAGMMNEPQKHLTQFAYNLLRESSPNHSSDEMADLFAFNGAHLDNMITTDRTLLLLTCPKDKFMTIVPEAFDCLVRPLFREENLEIYQNQKIKDLEYVLEKTDFRSSVKMLQVVFGDENPAGQRPTIENLQAVTLDQLTAWHGKSFVAENLELFVTGNLNDEMRSCLVNLFSQIPHGQKIETIPYLSIPVDKNPEHYEKMPDCVQSSIIVCKPSLGYTDPEYWDFCVLSMIAGGYFGSRLMQRLREKEGYTYGISSGVIYFGQQSVFGISSDVNAESTRASVNAIFEELARLQTEPVSDEELKMVQSYMSGELLRSVDNSVSYMKKYAFWKHQGVDEQAFHDKLMHIRQITPERIQELAKKHFDYNNFTRIVVGKGW